MHLGSLLYLCAVVLICILYFGYICCSVVPCFCCCTSFWRLFIVFTEHNHASVWSNGLATPLTTLYPLRLTYWCIDECLGETGWKCLHRCWFYVISSEDLDWNLQFNLSISVFLLHYVFLLKEHISKDCCLYTSTTGAYTKWISKMFCNYPLKTWKLSFATVALLFCVVQSSAFKP